MPEHLTERPAEEGELCTCGRQAVVVYLGTTFGETGWCGRSDGGDRTGPCPFCGQQRRHLGRCPRYRLRLDQRGSGGGQPPHGQPMLFPTTLDPGRFIGPPSRR
jgi:hypothetical protein